MMSLDFNIRSYAAAISGTAVLLALDVLFTAGRIYAKRDQKQRLYLNDWLVIPALLRLIYRRFRLLRLIDRSYLTLVWL